MPQHIFLTQTMKIFTCLSICFSKCGSEFQGLKCVIIEVNADNYFAVASPSNLVTSVISHSPKKEKKFL